MECLNKEVMFEHSPKKGDEVGTHVPSCEKDESSGGHGNDAGVLVCGVGELGRGFC